jgi:SAM-dependent methyltransferase
MTSPTDDGRLRAADTRRGAAEYYDRLSRPPPGDIEFYQARLPERGRVLELGCGTGRVTLPLAGSAGYVHGLDCSEAMLAVCRRKLERAGLGERVRVELDDITNADLTDRERDFDLVIAPFRVMQNLQTDAEVHGMMCCIRRHLAPGGMAILNTFRPRGEKRELIDYWSTRNGVAPTWTTRDGDDTVAFSDDCRRFSEDPLIVFPRLIYRRYDAAGELIDHVAHDVAMRVWTPDQLVALVESHDFEIVERHGGYQGEPWDAGSELVIAFAPR